jgi:hypothetical protein
MLKQIFKENDKAILSENKQAMSVSFAVLIQNLDGNPEMVRLVYNLCRTVGTLMKSENPQCMFVLSNLTL